VSEANIKRHLSRTALEEYLTHVAPATIVVPGDPGCRLVVDPQQRRMALRTPFDGRPIPTLDMEYVELRLISESGTRWYEVAVAYSEHPHEAYLFLGDIADLLQQEGFSFEEAVESAVRTFEELLAHSRCLSRESQIGLFGELLFLTGCMEVLPVEEAVSAWKGFERNEHDFVFASGSFEVKTTTTETRRHRISGLDQLQPVPGSPLWLISVQLTSATPETGRTLTELVDDVRQIAGGHTTLEKSLARAGWRERDRPMYRTPYRLRSHPAAYGIDNDFPALTRPAIQRGCARPELIVEASYTIDVSPLTPGSPPSPADHFVKGPSHVDTD